jgi:hypothetical protein
MPRIISKAEEYLDWVVNHALFQGYSSVTLKKGFFNVRNEVNYT